MNPDTPQSGRRAGGKASRAGGAAGDSSSFDTNASHAQASTSAGSAEVGSSAAESGTGDANGRGQAARLVDQVKEKATSQMKAQKDRATAGLGGMADAVRQTGQQLRDQRHDAMAQVVEGAAAQLERFANHLKDRSLDELVGDAQRLARQQPALFVGGSFAAGLLAARFIKASAPSGRGDRQSYFRSGGETRRDSSSREGDSAYGSGSSSGSTVFGSGTDGSSFNAGERPGTGDVQGRGGL